MPFHIIREDITRIHADAIVNAANEYLAAGGGVCGAIFAAAGREKLEKACLGIGRCPTGSAVITPGFDLPAKYVIHAVGPRWYGGERNEEKLLRGCYQASLELAKLYGCESIAFPLISAGIFGYPQREAFRIASESITDFLKENEMDVTLAVFGRTALLIGEERFGRISEYIDDHYVEEHEYSRNANEPELFDGMPVCAPSAAPVSPLLRKSRSLKEAVAELEESFSARLFRLIDERGLTDSAVYKRANMDRRLFSKLRKEDYSPSKATVLALAIALELNSDEARDLLKRAGYALSDSSRADVIVSWFLEEKVYDIFAVNEALFDFGERPLSS
ncbi:MAG: macro domain-containing protein [Oscillospiraceae bacterium]|nr:macro domain-containing protein [Oscillospiraceae bacterium]